VDSAAEALETREDLMPRITEEQRRSSVRVAMVQSEVTTAIGKVLQDDGDLTYEEVLAGLVAVTDRQLVHLRSGQATPIRGGER
jgi:hypothetical protein